MAHKIVLVDDLDGSELSDSAVTTRFSLDGSHYEIDLGDANREKLREVLAPFIAAGRKAASTSASGTRRSAKSGGRSSAGKRTAAIREWANANGHSVGERGRIPANIVEAYEAATGN